MGTASRICSVILRLTELICASVVVGIVGEYLHYFDEAGASNNPRMVYVVAIGGISLVCSLVLAPPLTYSFYAFLLDFALFICWITAFGLLVNLSGGASCSSYWYWNNWGYYWGGFYVTPNVHVTQSLVGTAACGKWRAVLAFCFIGGFAWLFSGFLGLYVISQITTTPLRKVTKYGNMQGSAGNNADISSHVGQPGVGHEINNPDSVGRGAVTEKPSTSSGSDMV